MYIDNVEIRQRSVRMIQTREIMLKHVGEVRNNWIVREVKVDVAVNQFGKEGWEWDLAR